VRLSGDQLTNSATQRATMKSQQHAKPTIAGTVSIFGFRRQRDGETRTIHLDNAIEVWRPKISRTRYNYPSLEAWAQDLEVEAETKEELPRLMDKRPQTRKMYDVLASSPGRLYRVLTVPSSVAGKGMAESQTNPTFLLTAYCKSSCVLSDLPLF